MAGPDAGIQLADERQSGGGVSGSKYISFDVRALDPAKYSFPYHFHRAAEELFAHSRALQPFDPRKDSARSARETLSSSKKAQAGRTSFAMTAMRLASTLISGRSMGSTCANTRTQVRSAYFPFVRIPRRRQRSTTSKERKALPGMACPGFSGKERPVVEEGWAPAVPDTQPRLPPNTYSPE